MKTKKKKMSKAKKPVKTNESSSTKGKGYYYGIAQGTTKGK